jgi:hypothetical protein
MRYVDGKPHSIDTVVLSSQHSPEMSDGTKMKPAFIEAVIEEIIKPVLPKEWLKDTKYLVNPTGRFVTGGLDRAASLGTQRPGFRLVVLVDLAQRGPLVDHRISGGGGVGNTEKRQRRDDGDTDKAAVETHGLAHL